MLLTTSQWFGVCVPLQYTHVNFLVALPLSNLAWFPYLVPACKEKAVIIGESLVCERVPGANTPVQVFLVALPLSNLAWFPYLAPACKEKAVIIGESLVCERVPGANTPVQVFLSPLIRSP